MNKVRSCAVRIAQAKLAGLSSLHDIGKTGRNAGAVAAVGLLAAMCLWGGVFCPSVFGGQVVAQVDRTTVTLGDGVTLNLDFQGVPLREIPSLPAIPGFQMPDGPSSQQQININGMLRFLFGFVLTPTTEGDLTIPALPFNVGGQIYLTQPIRIKVLKPGASVPGQTPNLPLAFVTLSLPRRDLYLGEVVLLEERLCFQAGRQALLQANWGPFEAQFRVTPLGGYGETEMVTNNQAYRVRSWRALATPLRTGQFTVGPVPLLMAFGRITGFGEFWPEQRFRLASDAITFRVLPVPASNVPPSFNGAVGSYSLTASAAPTSVAVGDPITVKVRIAGRGQFEALSLPAQPAWRDFRTYPPTSTVATNDGIGLSCVKTFELVAIPQNHEVKALPPVTFSFFDPETKTVRTLSSQPIPLQVRPGGGGSIPLPTLAGLSNRTDTAEKPPEITALKVHLGALNPAEAPLYRRGWFLVLQLAPPALWLSLLARRRYNESLSRNPRLRRQRLVARLVAEGLDQLRRDAASNQAENFFAGVFRLLQEQIGERLDLPASAITEAIIEDRLRPLGLDEGLLTQLHDLFQECNLARYAAARTGRELSAFLPRVEAAMDGLKRIPEPEASL